MAGKDGKSEASGENGPKKGSKIVILLLAALLIAVLGGGGGVAYLVLKKPPADKKKAEEAREEAEPIFLPMDPFTVNLKGGQERFVQVTMTVAITDAKASEPIKARTPVLRDRVLRIIGKRTAEEMLSPEGKEKLSAEILAGVKEALPEALRKGVKEILFTSLIVQ